MPPRPYIVLGYLSATTASVRRREVVEFAARRAKEIGGDAIIVLSSGAQYAGTYTAVDAFTSGYARYASTTASATSIPLFAGKASVLIIKFK